MKLGIYSDAHFSKSSSIWNQSIGSKYTDRLDTLIRSFKFMYDIFSKNQVDLIINLGDTVSSEILDSETQSALSEALSYSEGIEEYWLIGNHERKTETSVSNSLSLLSHHPHIHLVSDCDLYHNSELNIIFQSYRSDEDISKIIEYLKAIPSFQDVVICTHQIYEGMVPQIAGGVSLSSYNISEAKILKIFNGHIHNVDYTGNYYQIGSLVSNNFGDNYDKGCPGFIIYDTIANFLSRYDNIESPLFITLDDREVDIYRELDKLIIKSFVRLKVGLSHKEWMIEYLKTFNNPLLLGYRLQFYNDTQEYIDQRRKVISNANQDDIYDLLSRYIEMDKDNLPVPLAKIQEFINQLRSESK